MKLCVGLFGTCGDSQWRKQFEVRYDQEKIAFYNPVVSDWTSECAVEEAEHLTDDGIILFSITGESTGIGSLSEVGFSILNAIDLDDRRDFVIYIEPDLDPELKSMISLREANDSIRARALVIHHLKKLALSNVYIVSSLEEMLEVSVALYRAAEIREPLQKLNPHRKIV